MSWGLKISKGSLGASQARRGTDPRPYRHPGPRLPGPRAQRLPEDISGPRFGVALGGPQAMYSRSTDTEPRGRLRRWPHDPLGPPGAPQGSPGPPKRWGPYGVILIGSGGWG